MTSSPKPGVRKTLGWPVLRERHVRVWQCSDAVARQVLESADVMSEGASRTEGGGSVYYGTTSLVLPLKSLGGHIPDERLEEALRWLATDPHVRLRILRLARREASQRARGELGRLSAELTFSQVKGGARIDVEVEAVERPAWLEQRRA